VLALPHLLSILQVSVSSSKCKWALFTGTAGNLSHILSVLEHTVQWILVLLVWTLTCMLGHLVVTERQASLAGGPDITMDCEWFRLAFRGLLKNGGLPLLYSGWGAVLCRNIPQSVIKVWNSFWFQSMAYSMYLWRPSKLVSKGLASVGGNVKVGILNKGMSHYWSVLCMKVVATMPHAPLCSSLPKIPFLDFKLCLTRQNISLGSCWLHP
jgi:hypothetical protein